MEHPAKPLKLRQLATDNSVGLSRVPFWKPAVINRSFR
jgi:hypothetical protein